MVEVCLMFALDLVQVCKCLFIWMYSRGQKKVSVPYRIINVLRAYLKRTR